MASRAIGAVLTIGALAPAAARAQGFVDYPVIYRPAKGAKDLRDFCESEATARSTRRRTSAPSFGTRGPKPACSRARLGRRGEH
jgi:hypothetical protein